MTTRLLQWLSKHLVRSQTPVIELFATQKPKIQRSDREWLQYARTQPLIYVQGSASPVAVHLLGLSKYSIFSDRSAIQDCVRSIAPSIVIFAPEYKQRQTAEGLKTQLALLSRLPERPADVIQHTNTGPGQSLKTRLDSNTFRMLSVHGIRLGMDSMIAVNEALTQNAVYRQVAIEPLMCSVPAEAGALRKVSRSLIQKAASEGGPAFFLKFAANLRLGDEASKKLQLSLLDQIFAPRVTFDQMQLVQRWCPIYYQGLVGDGTLAVVDAVTKAAKELQTSLRQQPTPNPRILVVTFRNNVYGIQKDPSSFQIDD
ncbi:uncharacterized protein BJ171DRAFT_581228 [Polychytrium aggregatum]|uniref:uncharacterized protein n=1 Tax=Polychytrium aggregatum TaxID=110093 RepID=UPI0022FF40B2|nr:uncharacterized protein BJ171DRAFT_581228 [Polychytrium aggregatum]KAI9205015.1 hypothetical protein BJ171DRAFT_581228 [Polychytrium aggregatum]